MTVHSPIRLGLLGCADIAWRRTLPAATAEPGLRLVAVASRSPARAQRFADRFGCAAESGYDSLLRRDDIDAVYVPLPAGLLPRWVGAALDAGKHVLAEKPLGTTEQEANDLVDRAATRGLVLMENAAFLLHGQHRAIQAMLAAGEIGELRTVNSLYGIPPLPADNIRYRGELGGGALLDLAFYPLRTAYLFLGPDLRVVGANLRTGESGVDVAGSALLANAGGTTACVSFGFEHFYRGEYELWGSNGRLTLTRAFTPPPAHCPVVRLDRQGQTETRILAAEDQFAALVRGFATAVVEGRIPRKHHDEVVARARLVDEIRQHATTAVL
ncbi:MAG TPA: Gfo/Idh/MocA family oxidoreductase [Micromonosporaceae bacterium]|nr:Gfo/Idh/MocA family oxidoreductase [Micromonosporaceae bacterium]